MPSPDAPPAGSRREVLAIAWPIWISMISVTTKGVVDMLMVGRLGTDALAGVGMAMILAFNALCFGMGILRSQKSLVSQYLGAGDPERSHAYGVQAFYLAVAFAAVCLLLGAVSGQFFQTVAGSTELSPGAVAAGADYFQMRLLWGGAMLLSLSISEYLRSTGRTRLPMAADLLAQPVNILLNWCLIFGHLGLPAMGVRGAALGTGLSDLFSFLLMLLLARPAGRWRPKSWAAYRLDLRRMGRVLSVGLAGGLQFTLEVGSFTLVNFFVGFLGTEAFAAHQAAISVLHFSFMSAVAIADGGAVLIGRYVGALDWDAVRRTFRSMLSLAFPVMFGMGLLFFAFGESIMGLYLRNEDPETLADAIQIGGAILGVAAVWQFGDAFQICFRFALRAAGDHYWVLWVGILCSWLLSAPLAALAVFVLKGDVVLVWWLWSIEIFAGSLIFALRWKGGKWVQKRLVEDGATTAAG